MDLRVIGGGAAALAFGAGGFSYVSMDEVLSHELRHVQTIEASELQGYMDSVVREFSDSYDYYHFEGADYVFVADIVFTANAATRTFGEEVKSEDAIDASERKRIGDDIRSWDYCATEDALMFTNKGYNYSVVVRDGAGQLISREICRAAASGLRPPSSV